jgi:DNA-binding MarR family transcriptional regulator
VTTTTATSQLELAARLRLVITRLARRLRQQSAEGLTPSQTSALASVDRHGPLTPSELAKIERVQRPTATRILSALFDAGLITREQDPFDRRIARVKLTPRGASVLARTSMEAGDEHRDGETSFWFAGRAELPPLLHRSGHLSQR